MGEGTQTTGNLRKEKEAERKYGGQKQGRAESFQEGWMFQKDRDDYMKARIDKKSGTKEKRRQILERFGMFGARSHH